MKKKYIIFAITILILPILILLICLVKTRDSNPVTLTLWHNYGGQMKNTMDTMVEEFNATVGRNENVIINVTSISGSSQLHEKLSMAANGDPGAPSLPDITTAYPKTALILAKKGLLVNLDEQFSSEELSKYIPRFIEEGRLNGKELYVFPTAKSTEVLFVNTTIFNRFTSAVGGSLDDLRTFEGIMKTARKYYEWTDKQTPDIQNDGKTFYASDSLFNYSLIGCEQLGSKFIHDYTIDFSKFTTRKVWNSLFTSSVLGETAIFDGYASDLAKTGDIVCSTGSTAGVMFFSPTVTYPDNTSEPAELAILPYPVFEGGKRLAVQRGAGMCIIKSVKEKERLAAVFLKWFTSPKNNLRFVASTGYLPVTEEAFGDIMLNEMDTIDNQNIKELLKVVREMQANYEFCISPLFDGVDELQATYDNNLRSLASETKQKYETLGEKERNKAIDMAVQEIYEEFAKGIKK